MRECEMRKIVGRCHCENISYEFHWPGGSPIPVRACSCTFCTKHRGVYTSHPQARLDARVMDSTRLSKYAFGTKTADFYVCTSCGVVPFVTCAIEGVVYAVVNVNTFEDVDPSELDASVTNFDGEDLESRVSRRQRNWIGNVSVRIV